MKIIKFKRREKGKTDYKRRLKILLADKLRVVIRKSLNNILIQLIEYNERGDLVIVSSHSSELKKKGWRFNNGNIPSAYLTGFLFGKKIKKKEIKNDFVIDIGLNPSIKGSRIYAALKGMIDSGLNIPHSKEIFPSEDRIKGKHIFDDIEKEMEELKKENIMAEEGKIEEEIVEASEIEEPEKKIVTEIKEGRKEQVFDKEAWQPKTSIGKKCKSGEIKKIEDLLDEGIKILEPEIIDLLTPNAEIDLLLIGQSKGKFGGGQRRVFKQTQKKTQEGNKPKFSTCAVVGNKDGFIGVGFGKAKETVPAREKAIRDSKLNLMKIKRGCGSWQCSCDESHSIPFKVRGKCGSVIIELIPAPKGTGLCVEKECAKILALAGIKDIWSKTYGQTGTKLNIIYACLDALKKIMEMKVQDRYNKELKIIEGAI